MLRAAPFFLVLVLAACADKDPRDAVAATLPDPGSARFQSISDRGDHVCGEVNSRTGQGGYTGYTRFVYDKESEAALVDPGLQAATPPAGPPDAACSKTFSYQTVEERLACAAQPEAQGSSNRQRAFDALWERVCR